MEGRDAKGRFVKGCKKSPNAGRPFTPGHTFNRGRPSPFKGVVGRYSEETLDKIRAGRAAQTITPEVRRRMSASHKARREQNHFWRGGITEENKAIRNGLEYKLWRESVFERDDYTCQFCGARGVALHADHIKPFAYFPELRFDVNNGRTLCIPCHKSTDSYLVKARINYAEIYGGQIETGVPQ